MEIIYRDITTIRKAENNPRTISEEQLLKLQKSIQDNPDYFEARPIILSDRTGELIIIAGNQRYEACLQLGIKEVPTVIIPNLTEDREREIMIRDNVNNGEWDMQKLMEWDLDSIIDWGVDMIEDEGVLDSLQESRYTKKIDAPVYEPTQVYKPSVESLYDIRKFEELAERIQEKELPENIRDFLMKAATRHIVFDYGKIAEFYAQSDKDIQELMEESALVIIDFDKAVENGYTKLKNDIYEIMQEDIDDEE